MPEEAQEFAKQVETWPGYFTSSWIFQGGMYLIIDNISKFLSIDNCHAIIMERLNRLKDRDLVARDFEGSIIMARYGPHRTYKVTAVRWDLSPGEYSFEQGEGSKRVFMLDYFLSAYGQKIHHKD